MIYDERIEKARNKVPIERLIGRDVKLDKREGNYWGTCPFCGRDTFSASPKHRLYYCFGCHNGGTALNYLIKAKGISFIEALELLEQEGCDDHDNV